jgi:F-box-like
MLPMLAAVDPVFMGHDLGLHFKAKRPHPHQPLLKTQPQSIYTPPVLYSRIRPAFKRLSPMDKLPVELLAHIFLLATHLDISPDTDGADEVVNDNLPFNPDNIPIPLAISSVNRQWREIALTTPGLWSSICVVWEDLDRMEEDDAPLSDFQHSATLNTRHINMYLARSGNSPIDIIVDARDPEWDFVEPESGCVF